MKKIVVHNDPALPLPNESIARHAKLSKRLRQIRLLSYPIITIGNGLRSFQSAMIMIGREIVRVKNVVFCFYCRAFSLNDVTINGHIGPAFISKPYSN